MTSFAESPVADPVLGSLSPSRAAEFKACPLRYRFRSIDRLPESPSLAAVRGTLVHSVLESLFDLPAAERTQAAAVALLPAAWTLLREQIPDPTVMFEDAEGLTAWLTSAEELLANYFRLEDPAGLEPWRRELAVDVVVGDVQLRGVLDRLDVTAAGDLRIVDYKTGSSPTEAYESDALFQLKFYALVLWRTRGVVPTQLRLIYLRDTTTLTYSPDAAELERFERTVLAIWAAIRRALPTGDFQPNPGRACRWCAYRAYCPVFDGTPPVYQVPAILTDPRDSPENANSGTAVSASVSPP